MRSTSFRTVLGVLTLACFVMLSAQAQLAEEGRAVFEKNREAVVTVKTILKVSGGGGSQEQPMEVTGTVIDSNGLTVLSLSAVDPSDMMRKMYGEEMEISAAVTDVKILQEGGEEIDSEIILRDKDRDLAFVRPREKQPEPMACVDMSAPGRPEIMDEVIALNRLGKVARRAYSASIERIEAIVDRPRTFYIPGKDPTNTGLGSPAFTRDGKFIGIGVIRAIKSQGGFNMFGGGQNAMVIIMPAEDIQEAATQAPPFGEAPKEEAPAAEPKEDDEK